MYSENAITQAFNEIKETEKITTEKMAGDLSISRTSLGKILLGNGQPSSGLLIKVMNTYPNLNLKWIFSGKGLMYKEESVLEKKCAVMEREIYELKEKMKTQVEFIDLLKDSREMYIEKVNRLMNR